MSVAVTPYDSEQSTIILMQFTVYHERYFISKLSKIYEKCFMESLQILYEEANFAIVSTTNCLRSNVRRDYLTKLPI